MDTAQRILVVDDNTTNRRILVRSLGKMGYDMIEARDGFEAVDLAASHAPDLVLLDIMMPERDGFEVCRILKSDDATLAVPIIFLTAKSETEDLERAFALGGCDYLTKPFKMSEIKARVSVHLQLRRAQREADERNKQLEEMSKIVAASNVELAVQARIDPLTKLYNRRAWEDFVTKEHDRCLRRGSVYSIVMLDVDYFKSFNDSQGHQAGDDCLERVAERIDSACRATDVVGRYGGEEFVVLAPDTDTEHAIGLAERIRQAIADLDIPHPASSIADQVTASLGVANWDGDSWEDVLRRADEALYTAKETGRNTVCADSVAPPEREDTLIARQGDATLTTSVSADANEDRTTVLIVDDNATNRIVCRRSLEHAGYHIREAVDGRAALNEVAREHPSVILMDVMMPVMDGLQCTRLLRANRETQDIPIIIVSARADTTDIQAGLEAGADEYLTKPIKPAELALRVRSMAKRRSDRLALLGGYEVRGEQTRVLNILLDLCRMLGNAETLEQALEQTIAAAAALTGCRRISIMLPDVNREVLTVATSIGIDQETAAEASVPIGESIAGRVLESGHPIVINSDQEIGPNGNRYDSPYFSSTPLICTALGSAEHIVGVLNATDRVGKQPFEPRELESVEMIAGIAGTAVQSILARRARDDARDAIMVAFAKLAENRDGHTRMHVDHITQYCLILAEDLRKQSTFYSTIDDAFMYDFERSVPLHDIGKIAVPDGILRKPGRLTSQETTVMRTHAEIGAETIRTVRERAPGLSMLKMAEDIAFSHHEWFDGTGYPDGLSGDDIPLSARIVAVADVYDAVTSKRPYKEALSHEEAVAITLKSSGTQFDPAIVEAFMRHEREFKTLSNKRPTPTESPCPNNADRSGTATAAANVSDLENARSS